MLMAVGRFLLGLLAVVIIVYTLRRFVLPILGLPADIGDFVVFIIGVLGLIAAIYWAWQSYRAGPPSI